MREIAVLMAAGLGTRMRPLTKTTPKPLIKVNGRPMIETVIDGLQERGVEQFIVVVGYLRKQFQYLKARYDNLIIVENVDFATVNNISSLYAVSDILINTDADCFICESDLYVSDFSVFNTELAQSCYFGKMVMGHSDDWVFDTNENGRITRVSKGGDDLFNMVGIAYFRNADVHKLGKIIKDTYGKEGTEHLFWDDIVDRNIKEFNLVVHEIKDNKIIEIDSIEELGTVDASYSES